MIINALLAIAVVIFILFHNLLFIHRSRFGTESSTFVRMVLYVPLVLLLITMLVRRGWPHFGELAAVLSLMQYGISRIDWAARKGEPHRITYPAALLYLCFILTFVLGWFSVLDMLWTVAPILSATVLASYYETFMTHPMVADVTVVKAGSSVSDGGDVDDDGAVRSPVDHDKMEELYKRILTYMETEKPYLDDDLQMEKMASAVFTNKSYLSRTINVMSGRNFCQFVNFYRINYAVELMKQDYKVKVSELALAVGFHTVVSFNMAFKLYMNTTPSEYLRTLQAQSLENRRR